MNAILLCGREAILQRVYAPEQLARLSALVTLRDEVVTSLEQLAACGSDVDYIFSTWGILPLSEEIIRTHLPQLKAVFYAAGSVQGFARPYMACGVQVYSAWHGNAVPVAEMTVGQILLANKGYFNTQPLMRKSNIQARRNSDQHPGNYNARIGLLGCGAIGSHVAQLLQAFHLDVLVCDPYLPQERAEALGVRICSMDEIFATCDVISNHLPNLPSTVGIIKREHLLSMQPYATFINTGRGAQLNEADLYDALTEAPTRTALLDVLANEPDVMNNPLNSLPNCFITPHIAGSMNQELHRLAEYMLEALAQYESGLASPHLVTEKMLETMA